VVTGLGLTIVYQIIKDHNGKIDVESELGRGTTIRITLPVGRCRTGGLIFDPKRSNFLHHKAT